eukprot:scaffold85080_cov31-Tisochrysis_lutea.AAC.6
MGGKGVGRKGMGGTVGHGEEGRAPSPDDLDRSYTSAPKWWTDDVSAALADDELAFARRRAHTARRLPKQRGAEATRPGVLESGGERRQKYRPHVVGLAVGSSRDDEIAPGLSSLHRDLRRVEFCYLAHASDSRVPVVGRRQRVF